jgi:hypothetical protein
MDPVATVKATYEKYHPTKVYRYVMADRKRKLIAVGIVAILVIAIFAVLMAPGDEGPEPAHFNDLLASQSTRAGTEVGGSIVASDEDPYFAVISTPVAVHYEETGDQMATPLLVAGSDPSISVNRFLLAYNRPTVITVGPVEDLSVPTSMKVLAEDVKHTSTAVAETFWTSADGAMVVRPSKEGYDLAVAGAALACYLDIPIIVTDEICPGVTSTMESLDVKYTVALGDAPGYGRVYRLESLGEIQDTTRDFIRDPQGLGGEVEYLTITNPDDVLEMNVLDYTTFHFEDQIYDHSARDNVLAGTTPVPAEVDYDFEIPSDYEFCNVHFTLKFRGNEWADEIGSRIYAYCFDGDEEYDGGPAMETFFGTPAGRIEGEYRIVDFDLPLNNDTGPHLLSLMAREIWSGSPPGPAGIIKAQPEWFYLDVVVEKLESPVYPLMGDLSSVASYLTAYRQGVTMASPSYSLMSPSYQGCVACDEPTINEAGMWAANVKAMEVHNETVKTLARLVGVETEGLMEDHGMLNELADHYYYEPVDVGIIADTNMVPHYYFPGGMAQEGYGEPGDIIYGDINMDPLDPPNDVGDGRVNSAYPDLELPVGRIDGFDVQDTSALLSRTFFYYDIIDSYTGYQQGDVHTDWKNNGYVFLGSEIPVETMYPSLITQVNSEFSDGGFNPKSTTEILSHRANSQKYQEGSNYIIGGVHGFYYWYVPAARTKYAGGSAYDVAHVRDMDFGPSTMYMVSCVVGRIDGLDPENSLAMAYMHGGMNAYIGATRSTYGWIDAGADGDVRLDSEGAVLMGEYFSEYVLAEDQTVGLALRNAKNDYIVDDGQGGYVNDIGDDIAYMIYGHYILHGDPAFNPYEPRNI